MNEQSTIVINSKDPLFIQKTIYSLEKAGFKISEDYINNGLRIIVFIKS
jgi:hypothetical protein